MLLLGAKLGWPLVGLVAFYAIGGEDAPSAELTASAKIDAEQALMRHISTAGPEIERRLGQWLTARNGLLYVREPADAIEPYAVHVLPAVAPWRASCGVLGLTLIVGGFQKDITEVALDDRQCDQLLAVLGRAMLTLTTTDDLPARQPRKEKPWLTTQSRQPTRSSR